MDVLIARFSPAGRLHSAFTLETTGRGAMVSALAVDDRGNSFVTGFLFGSIDLDPGPGAAVLETPQDLRGQCIFLAKHDARGKLVWRQRMMHTKSGTDHFLRGLSTDGQGSVHAAGTFQQIAFDDGTSFRATSGNPELAQPDGILLRFDANGRLRPWSPSAARAEPVPGTPAGPPRSIEDVAATLHSGERDPLIGTVMGLDGRPWKGARVTLVSRLVPWCDELPEDRIEVRTDERGKLRAELLRDRRYSAWASHRDDSGNWHVTDVREDVIAGPPLALVGSQSRPMRVRIRLAGTERWKDKAPLRVRVVPWTGNLYFLPVALDARNEGLLPILPGGTCHAEVLAADGTVLLAARVFLTETRRRSWRQWEVANGGQEFGGLSLAVERIELGAPKQVRARVVDGVTGVPIEGAILRHRASLFSHSSPGPLTRRRPMRQCWTIVGKTDRKGTAPLRLPRREHPLNIPRRTPVILCASAPGFADRYAGWLRAQRFHGAKFSNDNEDKDDEIVFRLTRSKPLTGRILERPKTPLRDAPILVRTELVIQRGRGGNGLECRRQSAVTDREGRFTVLGIPDDASSLSCLTLLPERARRLLQPNRTNEFPIPPSLSLRVPSSQPRTLGSTSLANKVVVPVRIIGKDGGPARGAAVQVVRHEQRPRGIFGREQPAMHADRRGTRGLLLEPGTYSLFCWSSDAGYALHELQVSTETTVDPRTLRMQAFDLMRGMVVSGRGSPVAGARLRVSGSGARFPFAAVDGAVSQVNQRALLSGITGPDGRFALPFVFREGRSYRLQASHAEQAERGHTYEITKPEDDVRIVLEMNEAWETKHGK